MPGKPKKRRTSRCRKLTEHQTIKTKKKKGHILIKTLNLHNKERIQKASKEKNKAHIKENPLERQHISQHKL
jgi:hypothetical protein